MEEKGRCLGAEYHLHHNPKVLHTHRREEEQDSKGEETSEEIFEQHAQEVYR